MRLYRVLILCCLPFAALAEGERPLDAVDVAIVVSYDRSESIDRAEAASQIQGLIYSRLPNKILAISSPFNRSASFPLKPNGHSGIPALRAASS